MSIFECGCYIYCDGCKQEYVDYEEGDWIVEDLSKLCTECADKIPWMDIAYDYFDEQTYDQDNKLIKAEEGYEQ